MVEGATESASRRLEAESLLQDYDREAEDASRYVSYRSPSHPYPA